MVSFDRKLPKNVTLATFGRKTGGAQVFQRGLSPSARPVWAMDHGASCIPACATHARPLHAHASFSRRPHPTREMMTSRDDDVSFRPRVSRCAAWQQPAETNPSGGRSSARLVPVSLPASAAEVDDQTWSISKTHFFKVLLSWWTTPPTYADHA